MPDSVEAGTIVVLPGSERTLRLIAEDAAGNQVTRTVVLLGNLAAPRATVGATNPSGEAVRMTHVASLPGGWLRVTLKGGAWRTTPAVRLGTLRGRGLGGAGRA